MSRQDTCRGCGAVVIWKKTAAAKWTPENPDGTPHWATCPKAKDFKKKPVNQDGLDKS